MWFNQGSPFGMLGGMGMGQGMTPGAGMPPVGTGNSPMSMQPRQMSPGGALPSQNPPMGGGQQPMNPAQMGMLSGMMRQNTQQPQLPQWSQISDQSMAGVLGEGTDGAANKSYMQGLAPDDVAKQGLLSRWFSGLFGS